MPCPTCGAAAGERCDPKMVRSSYGVCSGRFEARPIGRIFAPGVTLKGQHNKGRNPCSRCRAGDHFTCTGRHGRNHGMPGQLCTCSCENAARARAEAKLGETLI